MAEAEATEQKPVLVEEDDDFEEFAEKDWKEEKKAQFKLFKSGGEILFTGSSSDDAQMHINAVDALLSDLPAHILTTTVLAEYEALLSAEAPTPGQQAPRSFWHEYIQKIFHIGNCQKKILMK